MKPTIIAITTINTGSRVATILSTAILDSYSMESAIEFSIVSRLPVSSPTLTAEVSFFVNPFILSRASDKFPPERTLATASSNWLSIYVLPIVFLPICSACTIGIPEEYRELIVLAKRAV